MGYHTRRWCGVAKRLDSSARSFRSEFNKRVLFMGKIRFLLAIGFLLVIVILYGLQARVRAQTQAKTQPQAETQAEAQPKATPGFTCSGGVCTTTADEPSVQGAINAASSGNTIEIADTLTSGPASWTTQLVIPAGKSLTIHGQTEVTGS